MSESEEAVAPPPPPPPLPLPPPLPPPLSLPPPPEQYSPPLPPPPLQIEAPPEEPDPDTVFRLWPPTRTTRDTIISRLVETLSAPLALSARYGTLPRDEVAPITRAIEQEEYAAAAAASPDDDGADVLQAYATAIARCVLDSLQLHTTRNRGSFPPKTPEVLDVSPSFDSGVERSSSF